MKKVFNKSKPYGTVCGISDDIPKGAKFEQNGMYFNQAGEYISGEPLTEDTENKVVDLQAQLEALQAENAALKASQIEVDDDDDDGELDRNQIIQSLKERAINFYRGDTTEKLYAKLQKAIDAEAD